MAKYDINFKLKIVTEYLNGKKGYKELARKYGVKSYKNIHEWVQSYKVHGVEALHRRKVNELYTGNFKLSVLQYMKITGASIIDTAIRFNISKASTISAWNKKFIEGGADALSKPKGRPRVHMSNTQKNSSEKQKKKLTREQLLEKEILLLRIENEYLKKLQAHGLKQMEEKTKKK